MGRFHAKDGWCFERQPTGSVRIDSPKGAVVLDANTWASVVASVSKDGENRQTFDAAEALHGQTDAEKDHYMTRGRSDMGGDPLLGDPDWAVAMGWGGESDR